MGELAGVATGRQVREEVLDSRRTIIQARDEVRLYWSGGQCGAEEKRTDSGSILWAVMTGLADGLRGAQGREKARKTLVLHTEQVGKRRYL